MRRIELSRIKRYRVTALSELVMCHGGPFVRRLREATRTHTDEGCSLSKDDCFQGCKISLDLYPGQEGKGSRL